MTRLWLSRKQTQLFEKIRNQIEKQKREKMNQKTQDGNKQLKQSQKNKIDNYIRFCYFMIRYSFYGQQDSQRKQGQIDYKQLSKNLNLYYQCYYPQKNNKKDELAPLLSLPNFESHQQIQELKNVDYVTRRLFKLAKLIQDNLAIYFQFGYHVQIKNHILNNSGQSVKAIFISPLHQIINLVEKQYCWQEFEKNLRLKTSQTLKMTQLIRLEQIRAHLEQNNFKLPIQIQKKQLNIQLSNHKKQIEKLSQHFKNLIAGKDQIIKKKQQEQGIQNIRNFNYGIMYSQQQKQEQSKYVKKHKQKWKNLEIWNSEQQKRRNQKYLKDFISNYESTSIQVERIE